MNDLINQINNKLNIVDIVSEYVPLSKKGKNFWGVCPFHQDSNPSMSVSPEKQIYKCFSCGASGGIVNFVADIKKISFNKAIGELAKQIGIEITNDEVERYTDIQKSLISAFNDAMLYMQYMLMTDDGKIAKEYADARGLSERIIERFKIGYAPNDGLKEFLLRKGHDEATLINASLVNSVGKDFFKDRLMFPILNELEDVVGFSARTLKNEDAKYINSAESLVFHKSKILYNFNNAQDIIQRNKEVFICEGQMDVIALDRSGISNAVAVMGTALTKEHLNLLKDVKIILNFDNDKAGIQATLKSIKLLLDHNFKISIVKNEIGKDADEILKEFGAEKLSEILSNQISAFEWLFEKHLEKYSASGLEGVVEFIKSFSKYISFATPIEKDFYINKISSTFNISVETIKKYIYVPTNNVFPKKQIEPPVEIQKNNKFIKTNYSFVLIRSMLSKPFLVDAFINNKMEINFIDKQLNEISKYIIAHKKGLQQSSPSQDISNKVKEIMSESKVIATTVDEFNDMIKKVNNEFYDYFMKEYKVKLKNESDDDKKNIYLSAIAELKQKKEAQ